MSKLSSTAHASPTPRSLKNGLPKPLQWTLAALVAGGLWLGMSYLATGTEEAKLANQKLETMRTTQAQAPHLTSDTKCTESTTKEAKNADGTVTRTESKKEGPCATAPSTAGASALFQLLKVAIFSL
jgi:hypothetical protein